MRMEEKTGPDTSRMNQRKDKVLFLLGLISIITCSLLFILQSYLALMSYQILHQLNGMEFPEIVQPSHYNDFDFEAQKGRVYLRANTSLFIH